MAMSKIILSLSAGIHWRFLSWPGLILIYNIKLLLDARGWDPYRRRREPCCRSFDICGHLCARFSYPAADSRKPEALRGKSGRSGTTQPSAVVAGGSWGGVNGGLNPVY